MFETTIMYTESQVEDLYDDFLNEIGEQGIEGYAYLLQKGDSIAYEIGYTDFIDKFHQCNECDMFTEDDLVNGLCENCIEDTED